MKIVPLGEIATIDRKAVKPEDIVNGTTYVGLENIVSGGEFVSVGPVANGELASGKFAFDERHVLYGKLRPYLAKIAVPSFSGVCSTDILPIRVGSAADKMYVAHFLRQTHIVNQVNGLAAGANLPRISPNALLTIQLPLPPLDEQRRIAAILDKADELRTKRRQALAHLDSLTQSVFHSMFDETELPTVTLGSVARFYGGNSLPEGLDFRDQANGYLLLKVSDMNRSGNERLLATAGSWSETPGSRASTCPPGCVVLPKRGASISTNKKRLTVRHSVLDPNLMAIEPSSALDSAYLFAWFEKFDLTAITSGSSVPQLNKQDLQPLPVPLPPLELQQTFATRVAAVERLKELYRKHLADLDALFASLQHRAFKGEL